MDSTLFSFIWKHSKRSQLILLAVTLATFPLLYVTLELPKRIINDAIGGDGNPVDVFGYQFEQMQFLMVLCFLLTGSLGTVTIILLTILTAFLATFTYGLIGMAVALIYARLREIKEGVGVDNLAAVFE